MKSETVTALKREATNILRELQKEKEPILITEHGKPAAYLVDIDYLDRIQKKLKLLEGIARGEKAILEGRTVPNNEATNRMNRRLK